MRAAAMALAAVLALAAAGCSDEAAQETGWPDDARYYRLETEQGRFSQHDTNVSGFDVLVDHETGVEYLLVITANGAALAPLLGEDGLPLTDEG